MLAWTSTKKPHGIAQREIAYKHDTSSITCAWESSCYVTKKALQMKRLYIAEIIL